MTGSPGAGMALSPAKEDHSMLPIEQIERFSAAVDLLGGQPAAARILNIPESVLRELCDGKRPLNVRLLRDISRALIAHAKACRLLERRLSPAFLENILPEQESRIEG